MHNIDFFVLFICTFYIVVFAVPCPPPRLAPATWPTIIVLLNFCWGKDGFVPLHSSLSFAGCHIGARGALMVANALRRFAVESIDLYGTFQCIAAPPIFWPLANKKKLCSTRFIRAPFSDRKIILPFCIHPTHLLGFGPNFSLIFPAFGPIKRGNFYS